MATSVQQSPAEPVVPEPVSKPSAPKRTPAKPAKKKAAKASPAKKSTAKKPVVGAKQKRNEQFPWLVAAVASAREMSGQKPGSGGRRTVAYAGPSQHTKIRSRVTEMLDGNVSPEGILKLSGLRSHRVMRELAEWKADRSEMTPLRPLSSEFQGDGWSQGRYLCAVLCAWVDELRRAKK